MKVIGVSGGLAAAAGLLSSVGLSDADVAAAQAAPRLAQAGPNPVTISTDDPDIDAFDVQFRTADRSILRGYMSVPVPLMSYSGIVIIHENRGLTEHHKDVARRYAKAGFAALVPDLVTREGGTDNVDPDQVPGMLATADPQRHVGDAIAAGAYIRTELSRPAAAANPPLTPMTFMTNSRRCMRPAR
jgi:carboxymethylenebutenolidase